jgi:hypothetical protein
MFYVKIFYVALEENSLEMKINRKKNKGDCLTCIMNANIEILF